MTGIFFATINFLLPLILVVGIFSALVAILNTINVLRRFRTASLAEIQVRLGAIEEMVMRNSPRE